MTSAAATWLSVRVYGACFAPPRCDVCIGSVNEVQDAKRRSSAGHSSWSSPNVLRTSIERSKGAARGTVKHPLTDGAVIDGGPNRNRPNAGQGRDWAQNWPGEWLQKTNCACITRISPSSTLRSRICRLFSSIQPGIRLFSREFYIRYPETTTYAKLRMRGAAPAPAS